MGPKYPRGYATFDTFSFQSAYSPAGTMTLPKNRPALGKQTQQTMGGFPLNRFLVSIMAAAVVNGFIPFLLLFKLTKQTPTATCRQKKVVPRRTTFPCCHHSYDDGIGEQVEIFGNLFLSVLSQFHLYRAIHKGSH